MLSTSIEYRQITLQKANEYKYLCLIFAFSNYKLPKKGKLITPDQTCFSLSQFLSTVFPDRSRFDSFIPFYQYQCKMFFIKSLFLTIYLIFQMRTMRIQWVIFGLKVSKMDLSGITGDRTFFMRFGRGLIQTASSI